MYQSNLLSVFLFLACAHRGHALPQPQDPPPADQAPPCLTTVLLGTDGFLVATPGPSNAVFVAEINSIDILGFSTSTLTSTGTIVRGATITPAGQHVMELTDDGHIELDGQLFDFGDAPCPRTVAQKSTAKRAVGEPTATAAPPEQPSQQDLPPAPEEEDGDSGTPFFPTREDCFPPCDSELPCPLPEPREFDDPCNVYLSGDGARQRFRA